MSDPGLIEDIRDLKAKWLRRRKFEMEAARNLPTSDDCVKLIKNVCISNYDFYKFFRYTY